ncbi:AMP-binding protein [Sulfurimonas marina]|uniref:Long-chain fatty acid--CoA ligase n=1 Tax=Sulfurimonas marina TaxID=2590551 RepID=A0A7M1AVJ4_9BACT|nr:AMP-binding protein [Sulfurimonas marina]QOP41406.1 long-chain fatty acid--CoA ligase [Sulfurimonas marina]
MNYPYENLENFTLKALLDRSTTLFGQKDVLSFVGKQPLKYRELDEKVKAMVELLSERGITKGDKVALLSENMPNWAVAYLAITYFGAIVVPILPDFNPSDVHHIIRHSEAKAVFVSEKHLQTIEDLGNSEIKFVIELDTLKLVDHLTNHSYMELIKQKFSPKKELPKPDEDSLAAILYTSGTTGHSKGVMLTHKNLVTNALTSYKNIEITPDDIFLSILPLAHTFECTVGMLIPMVHGSSVVYIDKTPTPTVLLKAFEVVRPTMILSVPLIIEKIFKNKILAKFHHSFVLKHIYKVPFMRKKLHKLAGKKLLETFGGRLRMFAVGGAPLAGYVEQFLIDSDFPYLVGYGLTETAPLLAGTRMGMEHKIGSTGLAMPGIEIKIKNPHPFDGEGEIVAKSPSVMLGYYKDEEKTKEVFDEDGYFLTGDLGYIDEDGYIFISGRSKNMILGPSGENIYPEQIESIINQNEAVLDALVMQQDGKLVARIHLDYELIDKMFEANHTPDDVVKQKITEYLENMRVEVNTQMASFSKITKFIEQIEPFVKTPTKKIKRYLYTA